MEKSNNPVIERQKFWYDSGLKNQYRKLIEGKLKFLFVGLSSIADFDKSIPPKVWSDFVDGIILFLFNLSGKSERFSESYIDELTKPGTEEIIKIFKNPKIQKAFIDRYQFSADTIILGKGIQTTIDAESLFRFNQLVKGFVIDRDSLVNLRLKFIEWMKKDYSSRDVASKAKARPTFESLDQIFHNPDFCYGILMKTEPPVISEDFRYLLGEKKKFKVTAWYQALHERGWVKSPPSPKDLINLLNEKMTGLDLGKDGRSLRGKYKPYGFEDFLKEMKVKIQLFKLH